MRLSSLHVLGFIIGASAIISAPLHAQRALTIGIGAGMALGGAKATDHSGLQLTVAAERALDRPGRFAARIDGLLVDWRVGHPAALSANVVLYGAPASRSSLYVLAGVGLYGLGDQWRAGANIGVGVHYRLARTALFAELRTHALRGGVAAIPGLTIGLRF